MHRIPKPVKWGGLVAAIFLIGLTIFTLVINALPFHGNGIGSNSRPTDSQYQVLLDKFSGKLLADVTHWLVPKPLTSTEPVRLLTALQNMTGPNQQPSIARLAIQYGQDPYVWERQEVTQLDTNYVDQDNVDKRVVKGYTTATDKPLFDQFVNQQLLTISNQKLDAWLTSAILTAQLDHTWPTYNPAPHVDHASYVGDMTNHGGSVIDGIANVYLIFWIDSSFQSPSPKYVSLIEQFVNDIGQSPLYANLLQYTDSSGRHPTGARLVDTFTDTRPFPQELVAARKSPTYDSSSESFPDAYWHQEIQYVAGIQNWNAQDSHNLFILLPTINWGCGWHSNLTIDGQAGSPYAYGSYPYYQGQEQCAVVPQSPNQDHVADIATGIISHEIMEAVSDPYAFSWYTGNIFHASEGQDEMADKCPLPSSTINPKTNGNVTWNGHTYVIQEEYDNFRHGCVLEGP